MNVLSRVKEFITGRPANRSAADGSIGSSGRDRMYWAATTSPTQYSGATINAAMTYNLAFSNPWEVACLSRISEAAQARVVFKSKKTGQEIKSHPWLDRLQDPNPDDLTITGFEVLEETLVWLEVTGVCYWLLDKASGINPPPFKVVNPATVTAVPSETRRIGGYKIKNGDVEILYPPEQVFHFKTFSPYSQAIGLPPQMTLRQAMLNYDAALRYNYAFFRNGGSFGAVIEVDDSLNDFEYNRIKERLKALHGGVEQSQDIPILEKGMKWKQAAVTAKDGEFIAEREQDRDSILAAHGVPASIAGAPTDVGYSGIEAETKLFWQATIPIRQARIAALLTKRICFETGDKDLVVEFDNSQIPILREGLKDIARWLVGFVRFGTLTQAESRRILNELGVLPIVLDPSVAPNGVVDLTGD